MRIQFIIYCLLLMPILLKSQISYNAELDHILQGKTKINEIKKTVNDYYNGKLSSLLNADTLGKKGIMRELKMWNRHFWMSEFYTDSEGELQDPNKINSSGIESLKKMNAQSADRYQTTNWMLQGPYWSDKGIGRADRIAFDPFNANIMYAASPHGGLSKTLDGGNNWFPLGDFLPSLGISGIAVDPYNSAIIYVLTGEANTSGYFGNNYISLSNGVYKSYDGGYSWFQTGTISTNQFRGLDLIINPNNPEILIAATSAGIYRTTNGGLTWNQESWQVASDLAYKPGDGNVVYATASSSFLRSTDGGDSFSEVNTGTLLNGADRMSIGVTPANNSKVVLFCGPGINNSSFKGLYQSTNSGSDNSFSLITNTPNLFYNFIGNQNSNSGSGQSGYNNVIEISPSNENDMYVGGLCVWRSTNGGVTWNQVSAYWPSNSPFMHPDIHEIKINPLNNKVYCGNDGGIYLYENNAWTAKYNGFSTAQFYHFERENDEGDIWGGCQDNGIQEQNGGGNYFSYSFGDGYDQMTDHDYLVDDGEEDDVYFTVNNFIRKDCAGSICDISIPNNLAFFGNLAMSPLEEDKIYVGYSTGLWRSFDAGDSWGIVSNKDASWCVSSTRHTDVVYFAGVNGLVRWVSGSPDAIVTPPSPYNINLKITDIDVDRLNENAIYVSIGGNQSDAKVFCSLNGGISWANLTFNLPNVPIFCIKLDHNNGLYVGTSIGVFYKPAASVFWQPFSNGLPPTPITEIEL